MLVSAPSHNTSNPFATRFIRPGAQAFLSPTEPHEAIDSASVGAIVKHLRHAHRGLIVGPHGTGKSTLVHALRPALTASYSSYLQVQLSRYPTSTLSTRFQQHLDNLRRLLTLARQSRRGGIVVLDGFEQVPWIVRWLFCAFLAARRCDLLATSHHQMRGFAELYRTSLRPTLIQHLANELVRDSDDESIALVQKELLCRDLTQVTNARDLWFELYDVVGRYSFKVKAG